GQDGRRQADAHAPRARRRRRGERGRIDGEAVIDEVVLGEPDLVESQLLGPLHLRQLVADDVVVALTGRGLEEEKRTEAEPGHTPRYLDFTASFAMSAAGALLVTIWPRERTCTVAATDSANGRFFSTSSSEQTSH